MTDDPIDEELEALLRRERNRPDEPPERIAAIRAGAAAKIAALGPGTGGSGSDGGPGGAGMPEAIDPKSASSVAPLLTRASTSSGAAAWLIRAGIFAVGATSGWIANEAVDARREQATHGEAASSGVMQAEHAPDASAETIAPTPSERAADEASAPPTGSVGESGRDRATTRDPLRSTRSTTATASVSTPTESAAAPETDDEGPGLAEERRLLESARAELARGSAARALELLEEHRRRFPSGRLSEEREALVVRALASAGRVDEARARAEAFHARYPRSVLRPAVDRAAPPEAPNPSPTTGPAAADPE